MNRKTTRHVVRLTAASILVSGLLAVMGMAEPPAPDIQEGGGKVTVQGTATIYGEWSCEGNAVVTATPGEALAPVPGFPGGVQATQVTVTVNNIECGDGTMNKHMRKALKAKDHPDIQFKTTQYTLNENGDVVKAIGELTIAGVTKPVELDASLINSPQGGFQVDGKVDIQMKDYKVKPPSLLFGTLKVANDVTIKYNANIEPPDKARQMSASLETE